MARVKWNEPVSFVRRRRAALALAAAVTAALAATPASAATAKETTFTTPEAAVEALVTASRADATRDLVKILGPEARKLVFSGDPVADKSARARFVTAFDKAHKIVMQGDDKAVVEIGDDDWPMPIPLIKEASAWRFDTAAGEHEILARRIGRNELGVIDVCRAYVEAQNEFASRSSGLREYAMKFRSSTGKHDGLYWPAAAGEAESPLGPLVASARAEGYGSKDNDKPTGKRAPYHGYYYKILMRQGKDASGGAYNYVVKGHMIGGFALVAYPAKYRDSGVMTFIVNQDGVVYQKDLGRNTATLAGRMTAFDPDNSWTKQ